MFSSTSNTTTLMSPFPQYYFPSISSPYHQLIHPHPPPPPPPPPPPSPPLILHQNDNIFLHQNHQYDQAVLFSALANNAQIPDNTLINLGVSNCTANTMTSKTTTTTTTTTKQDVIFTDPNNFGLQKKPTKKDRHSKIYTAQGLRDRRVRLSIDIAREFFDLHDMLGFDKASKTLEWLLTKSKKAIKELSGSKLRTHDHHGHVMTKSTTLLSSTANSDQCELNEVAAEHNVSPEDKDDHNNLEEEEEEEEEGEEEEEEDGVLLAPKRKCLEEKIDMETLSESALMSLLAKEARAKARARARARTKEKKHNYCTSSYNSNKIRSNYNMGKCAGSSSQISNQLIRTVASHLDQDQTLRSPNLVGEISQEKEAGLFRMRSNARKDDDQEEPSVVMIKRNKLKFPSISSGTYDHHQGQFCGISKGEASNSAMIYSSPSLLFTQNWNNNNNNISTASPHSVSFCLPT